MTMQQRLVLVADDVKPVRLALSAMLSAGGFTVATVVDGRDAVAYLRANKEVAAVILDWQMPNLDGIEALRELGFPAAARSWPPIIMHTTEPDAAAFIAATRGLGVWAVLPKPAQSHRLLALLDEAIRARGGQ
jgi:CheY-like chemotaxis protein